VGGRHLYIQRLQPRNPQGEPKLVYLQHGQGAWALASVLENEGIIRSAPVFYVAYKLYAHRGGDVSMQGSYFDLSPADGVTTIIEQRLKVPASRRVTFPEGFNVAQMGTRLGDAGLMISEQAFTAAAVPSTVAEAVDFPLPTESLEGYLFPDTYEFVVGTEPEDIVEVMAATFSRKFFQTHADEIKSSGFSLREIVTIASLIEREARIGADRPLISSVIRNRLGIKMRLQIDATVQYALPEHKERLTHEDLKTPSPFNTYLHAGLPPGPICNPGLACLEAALRPAKADYLFYVARPDGSHVFTKTYEEHLAAIRAIRGG
jgi:UPF0755 protein